MSLHARNLRHEAIAKAVLTRRSRSRELYDRFNEPIIVTPDSREIEWSEYERTSLLWLPKQIEAWKSTQNALWTLYGGAKGGSKTVGGVRIAQRLIASSRGGVLLVMRRYYTDLQLTTHQTYERFFPESLVISRGTHKYKCINDWEIWFYANDESRDPNYEKPGGLEVTAIHADEVSQMSKAFYEMMPSALRRPAYDLKSGKEVHRFIYATCNPIIGSHWTKRHFIDSNTRKEEDHKFIQSLPDDNPLLPANYIEQAFATMEGPRLQMMRYGVWDMQLSDFTLMPPNALNAVLVEDQGSFTPYCIGIDIGLGAPDQTAVWGADRSGRYRKLVSFGEADTMIQVEKLTPFCKVVQSEGGFICIDWSSVGKGVHDRLRNLFGDIVVGVGFGDGPIEEANGQHRRYADRRAQLYWHAREVIQQSYERPDDQIRCTITRNDNLVEELENTFYLPDEGRIRIEGKDHIKERLGRSPDDADAFVLAVAAMKKANFGARVLKPTPKKQSKSITAGFQ